MSVSQKPLISIVIPVLNSGNFIEKAIKSVIDQHYLSYELIILDGGSTDNTVDVIHQYQSHIHYWHSQPDKGPYSSINEGILKANGDLIGLLMADDWYEPGTFQAVSDCYMNNPTVDIFSCGGRVVSFNSITRRCKTEDIYQSEKQLALNFNNICNAVSAICCRFIKKSLYKKIDLFESFDSEGKYIISADKEWFLRAICSGAKNKVINHMGHTYFAHNASSTYSALKPNIMRLYQEHQAIAKRYLENKLLSEEQRQVLVNWYYDQSIRLMLRSLLSGTKQKRSIYIDISNANLWLKAFFLTSFSIAKKAGMKILSRGFGNGK